jgi:hypothetical protein
MAFVMIRSPKNSANSTFVDVAVSAGFLTTQTPARVLLRKKCVALMLADFNVELSQQPGNSPMFSILDLAI